MSPIVSKSQTGLETIRVSIERTFDIIKVLSTQSESMTQVISTLSKNGKASPEQIKELERINAEIKQDIDRLLDSISELVKEYNELLREAF